MRLQTNHTAAKPALSKIGKLLPPQKIAAAASNPQKVAAATAAAPKALSNALPKIASLYRVRKINKITAQDESWKDHHNPSKARLNTTESRHAAPDSCPPSDISCCCLSWLDRSLPSNISRICPHHLNLHQWVQVNKLSLTKMLVPACLGQFIKGLSPACNLQ